MPSGTAFPVVVATVPPEAVLGVPGQLTVVHDAPDLVALAVHDRERDLRRPGQVEADLGRVPVAIRVGRELLGLGGEANHERELALQLLRDEEGRDRRNHEQREDRANDGAGHGRGTLVVENVGSMRVQLIDPSADVLPYDHALAGALARRGAGVELITSRFVHGPAPAPNGYAVTRSFYRLATGPAANHPARAARAEARRARARHAAAAPPRHDGATSSTGSGSGSRP